jgi:hypothetical protein
MCTPHPSHPWSGGGAARGCFSGAYRRGASAAAASGGPLVATGLDTAQVKYSAFDRELLACVASFRHLRHMLEGRRFTIFTDHKLLTYALSRTSEPWSARQARQLSYLTEHTDHIHHIAGKDNFVADTLSRHPLSGCQYKGALQVSGGCLAGRQARILFKIWVRVGGGVCGTSHWSAHRFRHHHHTPAGLPGDVAGQ